MRKIDLGEAVGIKRKFDKCGRIVIPIECKKTLGIEKNDEVEMFLIKNGILIKKV